MRQPPRWIAPLLMGGMTAFGSASAMAQSCPIPSGQTSEPPPAFSNYCLQADVQSKPGTPSKPSSVDTDFHSAHNGGTGGAGTDYSGASAIIINGSSAPTDQAGVIVGSQAGNGGEGGNAYGAAWGSSSQHAGHGGAGGTGGAVSVTLNGSINSNAASPFASGIIAYSYGGAGGEGGHQ